MKKTRQIQVIGTRTPKVRTYVEDASQNYPGGHKGSLNLHCTTLTVTDQNVALCNSSSCTVTCVRSQSTYCMPSISQHSILLLSAGTQRLHWATLHLQYSSLQLQISWHPRVQNKPLPTCHSYSRLHQAGVDELLMMKCTGHHSLEGVRTHF